MSAREKKDCEKIVLVEGMIAENKQNIETFKKAIKKAELTIEALKLELDKELEK